MPSYILLTSNRTTPPNPEALLSGIKAETGDTTAVLVRLNGMQWTGKKLNEWTVSDVSAAQNLLDTAPELTPQLAAQQQIDRWPIMFRALVLTLIDAINVLRTHPAIGLTAVTPQQALTAIRNKAATFT